MRLSYPGDLEENTLADKLNVAIVGCGGISRYHLANILKTPAMRLAATMDVIEPAARERAEEGGAGYHTTDLERVLSDPGSRRGHHLLDSFHSRGDIA